MLGIDTILKEENNKKQGLQTAAHNASIGGILCGAQSAIQRFVFPPACLLCRAPVQEYHCVCASCFAKLEYITQPFCSQNGIPLLHAWMKDEIPHRPSPHCHAIRSACTYNETSAKFVYSLKYQDGLHVLHFMAKLMKRAGQSLLEEDAILVPVPMPRHRLRKRRYNQAALLSRALAKETQRPVAWNALKRRLFRHTQVALTRKERFKNMSDSFSINRSHTIRGKSVLLIDDVITTGATVEACARALKKAGARRVCALSFLRVVPKLEVFKEDY